MLGVNEHCFTRCVKFNPSDYKPKPLTEKISETVTQLIKAPESEKLIEAQLTEGEGQCINTCARRYVQMVERMIGNFEKRTTV
ncbi:hypothetical protein FGO68_gene7200 [Halteria grandinella]|uniref:Uncharacterized protein n=1 Tax=Halteria grandinella TaxID=5974 RepID=A0A8J8P2T4_HALGN|nr:hypothetical protein FGO68_gene7200 [Halteria grandinella]